MKKCKILFRWRFILIALLSCFTSVSIAQTNVKNQKEDQIDKAIYPQDVSKNYLYWYVAHKEKLDRINIFAADTASDTAYYKVDLKKVDFYINQIRKSDLVSEKYLDTLKQAYLVADRNFQLHPQNDGPVQGFEYDRILGIQEETEITENVTDFKVIDKRINNDMAVITGKISGALWIRFELSKTNGKWLIDSMHSYFK